MLAETWTVAHLATALTALAPSVAATRSPTPDLGLLGVPTCDGIELKIATQASDPRRSIATLVTQTDSLSHLVGAGDEVAGKRLVFVGENGARMSPAAWLETPTSLCQALLFEPPARSATASEPLVSAPPRRRFRSSRLRVVPELRDGAVVGIRLLGIEPGGLLATLGLENGDLLQTVNGFELATPEQALTAYARLRMANRLSLKLVRHGRPMTIDFVIQS